jgi:hypothetical protein
VVGANGYAVKVSKISCGGGDIFDGVSTSCEKGISNLANGVYYWQVQAVSTTYSGLSQYSDCRSFTIPTPTVTLTLYVHENSDSGPVLSEVQVTGQDGAGVSFSQTTNSNGYVTITGTPGTWSFTVFRTGYQTNSWSQSITTTYEKHAYLQYEGQTPEQAATCTLPPPTLISPALGAAQMALRPTCSWSSVSGANRYWLVVATDKNLLPTEPEDGFCEVYYIPTENAGLKPVTLYHPAYYNSIVVRLYNFDGKAAVPAESIVMSYEEKVTSEGEKYKEITGGQSFSSYEDAQAYVANQTSGNYRIVGVDPFSSPVPLEKLNSYKLVYPLGAAINATTVKIFEYLGSNES